MSPTKSFLQSLKDYIRNKFFADTWSLPADKIIILRADGTWILVDRSLKKTKPTVQPPEHGAYAPPIPRISFYDEDVRDEITDVGEILYPPAFVPFRDVLYEQLDKCLDAGVIKSCSHRKTAHGTYILRVEIPMGDDAVQNNKQLTLLISAMEEKYRLKIIDKNTVLSKTSTQKSHIVVFEYDPRKDLLR